MISFLIQAKSESPMRRTGLFFVVISLCLHGMVAYLLFFSPWEKTPEKQPDLFQEMTLVERPPEPKRSAGPRRLAKNKTRSKTKQATALHRLFQTTRPLGPSTKDLFADGLPVTSGDGGHRNSAPNYGDSDSLQGLILRSQPIEALAQLIMNSMTYPDVLIDNNITGKVSLRLELTPNLELITWEKPNGTNETLTAFVVVSVLKTLEDFKNKSSHRKLGQGTIKVVVDFEFSTRTNTPSTLYKSHQINDPNIYVHFDAYRLPKLVRWMLENLPIVPVPGGLVINVGAVISLIKDWDKLSPEMRRQESLRLFSEKMNHQNDAVIEKSLKL